MKKKSIVLMVMLMLVGITSGLVGKTFAKYTATVNGQATATVAKWAFSSDNTISSLSVNLDQTADPTTLAVVGGQQRIAPGTSGSFQINLNNEHSEVGVNFTLALNSIDNKPTNLKFYKDSQHKTELTPGSSTITGQLVAGDSTGVNVPIYWEWKYETTNGDAADTADGIAAKSLTIGLTVTGVQVQPGAAITSHIN